MHTHLATLSVVWLSQQQERLHDWLGLENVILLAIRVLKLSNRK